MNKKSLFVLALLVFATVIGFYTKDFFEPENDTTDPKRLYQLAFDSNKKFGYVVHIEENGIFIPYYVVTKNYFGQRNVLLLRKYLLESSIQYQDNHNTTNYYATSLPDNFLNTTFMGSLSANVREKIPFTIITIGVEGGGKKIQHGRTPEKIKRQIFLLSNYELGYKHGRFRGIEKQLSFFKEDDFKYRIGRLSDGSPTYWWLLSVPGSLGSFGGGVTSDGVFASQWMIHPGYLRPAFTLPPDTKIRKMMYEGEEVYVLVLD